METLGRWNPNWPEEKGRSSKVDILLNVEEFVPPFISVDHRRTGNKWSGGGPFRSEKRFVRYTPSDPITLRAASFPDARYYDGRQVAHAPPHAVMLPQPDVGAFGPELYRQASPAKPLMDLGNAIFELKDLPSMVKQGYTSVRRVLDNRGRPLDLQLKDVANFQLATNFGWLPLLSDTIGLYNAQRQLAATIAQLLRDNGRPVRRSFRADRFSSKSSKELESGETAYVERLYPGGGVTQAQSGPNPWTLSLESSVKVWFSGQFRYWLPEQGHMTENRWTGLMIRRLLGLTPTPLRIYKAMPWSWLIDWFANVGDNLANLNTNVAERLISDYAYVMRHSETFHRLRASALLFDGRAYKRVSAVTDAGVSLKERDEASPFGFRLKDGDLSPYQQMILSSLLGKRGIR